MAASKEAPASGGDFIDLVTQAFKMIEASWEALKLNLVTFLLVAIVPAAALFLGSILFVIPLMFSANGSGTASGISLILSTLVMIVAVAVALIFLPAITITQLESAKGNKVEFGEVFAKSKKYVLRYIGMALLIGLAAGIPMILSFMLVVVFIGILLVPLAIAWVVLVGFFMALAPYLLIDKDKGIVDTMKLSYEVTRKNWKWVLAVYIVMWIIGLPSVIPFVGWIVSMVLSIAYFCLLPIVYVKKIKA